MVDAEERRAKRRVYQRNWYARNKAKQRAMAKRIDQLRPEAKQAHDKLYRAVRSGKLIRQPCETCGDKRSQGHHDDYAKPLDVRWLCALHHKQI